jgi:hypothetical protein
MIPMVRRIAFAWLFLAATAALLAGCGKSSRASTGTANTHVTAQDITYADAINLRAADVPGLVGAKLTRQRPTRSGPFGTEMETCDGGVARSRLPQASHPERGRNDEARRRQPQRTPLCPGRSLFAALAPPGGVRLRAADHGCPRHRSTWHRRPFQILRRLLRIRDRPHRDHAQHHGRPAALSFGERAASAFPALLPRRGTQALGERARASFLPATPPRTAICIRTGR